jgi:hypothetical protein
MRGTSLEQTWNNIIAQTHAAAVKLGYRGDIKRWRELVCDNDTLNARSEIEIRNPLKQLANRRPKAS